MREQRPEHGARFILTREAEGGARATYRVQIVRADEESEAEATLDGGAMALTLSDFEPPPPPWAEEVARALLRTLLKNHADGSWPRRLTRWRAPR